MIPNFFYVFFYFKFFICTFVHKPLNLIVIMQKKEVLHFNILPSNDGKDRIHIFYDRGGRLFNVETQFMCFDGTPNFLLWFFRSIRNRRANVISINVGLNSLSYKDFVCEFGNNRFFETPDALVVLNFDPNFDSNGN